MFSDETYKFPRNTSKLMHTTVADSDLQIRGWGEGGGHPDPEMRASVCSKNKGGARAPPLDPPLYKTLVRPQIEYASTRL